MLWMRSARFRFWRLLPVSSLVGVMACQVDVVALVSQSDLKIAENDVPGTYVFDQHGSRDELVVRPDGTFSRTAIYQGVRQRQVGRWQFHNLRGEPASRIEFDSTTPPQRRHATWQPPTFISSPQPGQKNGPPKV